MQQGSFIQLDLRWLAHTSIALLNIPPYRFPFYPFYHQSDCTLLWHIGKARKNLLARWTNYVMRVKLGGSGWLAVPHIQHFPSCWNGVREWIRSNNPCCKDNVRLRLLIKEKSRKSSSLSKCDLIKSSSNKIPAVCPGRVWLRSFPELHHSYLLFSSMKRNGITVQRCGTGKWGGGS